MANFTGLFRRGGTLYLRIMLPAGHPLRAKYTSGKIVKSLGTCRRREAVLLATVRRAEILAGAEINTTPLQSDTGQAAATQKLERRTPLRHVYEKWIEAKSPSKDSIAACGRSLKLFEEQSGNPTLEQLSRLHGEKFRKWLIEQPTTSKTARDRMNWVKLLLNFAPHTVDFHFANPWVGMEIKWRTTLARQPWTAEHLSTLFNHKIWQHGVLPTDNKAGGVAAYWIPLLGLYTGARCSELCQLRVDDINWSDKVPTIRITDEGDDQSVKTMAGHRVIPIHSELIRLGLLDYVKSLNSKSLWPALPRRTDKAGGFFSQYFGTLRKSLDIPPDTVFHSFRHGVRSLLAEQGILEPTIDRILGHESGGSVGTRVYTHVTLETLQKAIETLTYKIPTISCLSKLGLV